MFLGLRTAIYHVSDIDKGKHWYSEVLGVQPYFDQPFYVGFNVSGYELGLQPGQLLELEVCDGRLQVEIAPVDIRLKRGRNGPVAVAQGKIPTLTADLVRQTLERTRR